MDNLRLALSLADIGWFVFPCNPNKSPMTIRGMKDATTEFRRIANWWTSYPDALIGVYCQASSIFALDVDVKHGTNGMESLRKISNGNTFPACPEQQTPTGGLHYVFRDGEQRIPNNSNQLGAGLDLRSKGYICTGGRYVWKTGRSPMECETPSAPSWLLEKISAIGDNNHYNQDAIYLKILRSLQDREWERDDTLTVHPGIYWLDKYMRLASPGCRNETGFRLACQLRDSMLCFADAEPFMVAYARSQGGDYTVEEALRSLRNAFSRPPREPAILPRKDKLK